MKKLPPNHLRRCVKCQKKLPLTSFRAQASSWRTLEDGRQIRYFSKRTTCKKCQNDILTLRRRADPTNSRARSAVHNAVKKGTLVKKPCELCGAEKVEAHHPDHKKPLEVRWLCRKHHMEVEYNKKF